MARTPHHFSFTQKERFFVDFLNFVAPVSLFSSQVSVRDDNDPTSQFRDPKLNLNKVRLCQIVNLLLQKLSKLFKQLPITSTILLVSVF